MNGNLSSGIWLGLAVLAAAGRALAGDPASPANTNLSAATEDYLRQLVVRGATNAVARSSNAPAAAAATNASLVLLDQLDDTHKLGIGDRVSYRVVEDKEDSKQLFVADSGELEIPYLGRVAAEGKTCLELAAQIKAVLEQKYYYHATVVLAVDNMNKTRGKIYLAGRVRVPGYQDIPTDEVFTVSKAILRAGGFGEFANDRRVQVTRKHSGQVGEDKVIELDIKEVLEKGQAGKDLELRPDDRVFVPSKLVNF
jgi:protein involved in polysaccharide export with SLBB domain